MSDPPANLPANDGSSRSEKLATGVIPGGLPGVRPSSAHTRTAGHWRLALLLIGAFALFAGAMIASGFDRGRGAFDQINYHLPVVRQFEAQWPNVDLRTYQSATTPGYHLVLAALARLGIDSVAGLRACGAVFTAALLGLLGVMVARRLNASRRGWWIGAALTAPVLASMYVLVPGAWMQPDNAGWLGVLAMIALAWRIAQRGASPAVLILAGAMLVALVLVRQIHVWTAGLIVVGAWLGAAPLHDARPIALLDRSVLLRRIRAAALASLCALPAALVLLWLRRLWGGLTPPDFQSQHAGGYNLATPAFVLSLLSIYSVFFGAWLWPTAVGLLRTRAWIIGLGVMIGAALALVPTTTYLYEPRSSGLWNLVKWCDARGLVLMGRTSPVILAGAMAGGAAVSVWLMALRPLERWFAAALLAGFVLAQGANANAWQRYLEPMLLMLLALGAAGLTPTDGPEHRSMPTLRAVGPLMLALLLAGVTTVSLARGERFDVPINPKAIPEPVPAGRPSIIPEASIPARAGVGSDPRGVPDGAAPDPGGNPAPGPGEVRSPPLTVR